MLFISDLDKFYHFVDRITTPNGVGGDTAEDVFGGLDAMLKLNWPTIGTKVFSNNTVRCTRRILAEHTV